MCVLIIVAKSIPPEVVFAAFALILSALLGAKVALSASGGTQLMSALSANTQATLAKTAVSSNASVPPVPTPNAPAG